MRLARAHFSAWRLLSPGRRPEPICEWVATAPAAAEAHTRLTQGVLHLAAALAAPQMAALRRRRDGGPGDEQSDEEELALPAPSAPAALPAASTASGAVAAAGASPSAAGALRCAALRLLFPC